MNSIRCQKCGFVNFVTEMSCRRCGQFLAVNFPQKSSSKKINYQTGRKFSFFPFVLLILVLSIAAFVVYGVRLSLKEVPVVDNKKIEEQKAIRAKEIEREISGEMESIKAGQERDRLEREKLGNLSEKMERDHKIYQENFRNAMKRAGEDLKKENEKNGIYK